MQQRQMIPPVGAIVCVKLKSRKRELRMRESFFWLIWLVVKELKTAKVIIKIDNKRELKSTNHF